VKHAGHRVSSGPAYICSCLVLLLLLAGLFTTARAQAAPPSVRYLPAGPGSVRIEVLVDRPPPTAIIVVQHLPPGVDIVQAEPPPAGFDRQRGEARWLFRQPQPGRFIVTLRLSQPVPPHVLRGELRFRPPSGGATLVLPIEGGAAPPGAGPPRARRR